MADQDKAQKKYKKPEASSFRDASPAMGVCSTGNADSGGGSCQTGNDASSFLGASCTNGNSALGGSTVACSTGAAAANFTGPSACSTGNTPNR